MFELPQFVTNYRDKRGRSPKVKLVGILKHRCPSKLRLLTVTEEHKTGGSQIAEAFHKYLNGRKDFGALTKKLFIRLGNYSRKNKNRNRAIFGYLERFVQNTVSQEIEVGFLPVGHTDVDNDQAFSKILERLKSSDAVSLDNLHELQRQTFNGTGIVPRLQQVANWSRLCESSKLLRSMKMFTQFRYLFFTNGLEEGLTTCFVMVHCENLVNVLYGGSVKN